MVIYGGVHRLYGTNEDVITSYRALEHYWNERTCESPRGASTLNMSARGTDSEVISIGQGGGRQTVWKRRNRFRPMRLIHEEAKKRADIKLRLAACDCLEDLIEMWLGGCGG